MVRAHIRIPTTEDCRNFVNNINECVNLRGEKIVLQDGGMESQVDARSLLGVIYATCEFGDSLYMVNLTNDGHFPSFVDEYRVL